MRTITLWVWLLFSIQFMAGQHIKNLSFSTATEHIIHQEFIVNADIDTVWEIWTTQEGLQSWLAPVVQVDWRRGGAIKSSFEVGGTIGNRNTVMTQIIDYIPNKRIVLKDDLTFLLSYGVVQNWIQEVSDEFLFELIADGADLITTIEFEEISGSQTKLSIFVTGYKKNEEWDKHFKNAISANEWSYQKLIDRFDKGPIDWSKN